MSSNTTYQKLGTKSHRKLQSKPKNCMYCNRQFKYLNSLRNHEEYHRQCQNNLNVSHVCQVCGKRFRDKRQCTVHMLVQHSENGTFKCFLCGDKFPQYSGLVWHFHQHLPEEILKCLKCTKVFPSLSAMEKHCCVNLGGNLLTCNKCSKTFSDYFRFLTEHPCLVVDNTYICPCCSFFSQDIDAFIEHCGYHVGEGQYPCNVCGKKMFTRGSLSSHRTRVHENSEKKIICQICGMMFAHDFQIVSHGIAVHGSKPFKCPYCPLSFARQCKLKYHIGSSHIEPRKVTNNRFEPPQGKTAPVKMSSLEDNTVLNQANEDGEYWNNSLADDSTPAVLVEDVFQDWQHSTPVKAQHQGKVLKLQAVMIESAESDQRSAIPPITLSDSSMASHNDAIKENSVELDYGCAKADVRDVSSKDSLVNDSNENNISEICHSVTKENATSDAITPNVTNEAKSICYKTSYGKQVNCNVALPANINPKVILVDVGDYEELNTSFRVTGKKREELIQKISRLEKNLRLSKKKNSEHTIVVETGNKMLPGGVHSIAVETGSNVLPDNVESISVETSSNTLLGNGQSMSVVTSSSTLTGNVEPNSAKDTMTELVTALQVDTANTSDLRPKEDGNKKVSQEKNKERKGSNSLPIFCHYDDDDSSDEEDKIHENIGKALKEKGVDSSATTAVKTANGFNDNSYTTKGIGQSSTMEKIPERAQKCVVDAGMGSNMCTEKRGCTPQIENEGKAAEKTGKRFYRKCSFCEEGFETILELLRHEKYLHRSRCTDCHKLFVRPDALQRHLCQATKNAMWTCQYCGEQFPEYTDFSKHRDLHFAKGVGIRGAKDKVSEIQTSKISEAPNEGVENKKRKIVELDNNTTAVEQKKAKQDSRMHQEESNVDIGTVRIGHRLNSISSDVASDSEGSEPSFPPVCNSNKTAGVQPPCSMIPAMVRSRHQPSSTATNSGRDQQIFGNSTQLSRKILWEEPIVQHSSFMRLSKNSERTSLELSVSLEREESTSSNVFVSYMLMSGGASGLFIPLDRLRNIRMNTSCVTQPDDTDASPSTTDEHKTEANGMGIGDKSTEESSDAKFTGDDTRNIDTSLSDIFSFLERVEVAEHQEITTSEE